ncbi:hypothetical protein T02_11353 [Trichinella nativa]|uniref:Uncharacterized protein n=1 Tax=Trichinella nativa TaxID=6335 RepID=A0A0V1KNQ9_9BILA|nr:hypothetical protein T02_11353 [Trichinella nativa]
MKIGGGESARQKGREIRQSIPARRQIAMDAPIAWWKKLEARGSGPLQRLLILKLLLETGGTVIPVPADQRYGIFENGISPPVNTIRFYKSYRVRVRFGGLDKADFEYQPLVIVDEVGNETSASV